MGRYKDRSSRFRTKPADLSIHRAAALLSYGCFSPTFILFCLRWGSINASHWGFVAKASRGDGSCAYFVAQRFGSPTDRATAVALPSKQEAEDEMRGGYENQDVFYGVMDTLLGILFGTLELHLLEIALLCELPDSSIWLTHCATYKCLDCPAKKSYESYKYYDRLGSLGIIG